MINGREEDEQKRKKVNWSSEPEIPMVGVSG